MLPDKNILSGGRTTVEKKYEEATRETVNGTVSAPTDTQPIKVLVARSNLAMGVVSAVEQGRCVCVLGVCVRVCVCVCVCLGRQLDQLTKPPRPAAGSVGWCAVVVTMIFRRDEADT